ncbi:TonB-dependent receptor [Flavobacteriaceae bacterium R38]|nr:TonB-dependent receptor [Flavobacteriaceae bacterium R38]
MKYTIAFIFLIIPTLLLSQFEIKGNVTDETSSIAWANIALTTSDGTIVTGGITDDDGNFKLTTKAGTYKLIISFIGYKNFEKELNLIEDLNLGTIVLEPEANALEEVTITFRKKLIEQKPDRIIFNVENSVTALGGNALDALNIAPGLRVQNNSINLLGRGESRVLVNGRLLQLTGEDLVDYLNTIAADNIKKIEVITTPPAKYEAAGNGGLINVILKKGALNSWKNTISLTDNINTYNFVTLRNSLLYNKNKLSLSFNLNTTKGNSRNLEEFQVFYPNSTWDININSKDRRDNISAQLLLDYDISNNTTIGLQYLGDTRRPDLIDESISSIFNQANALDSLLINNGNNRVKVNSHLVNLHSVTKLDTLGKSISFDLDYFSYDSNQNRNFITNSFLPNNDLLGINAAANTISDQKIENYSIKTDIEHPLTFMNLSYGAKISTIKNNSDIRFFNTITGIPVLDTNISNTFEYKENNQAIYVSGLKKINDKWDVQVGLRLENTTTEGFSVELNQTNTNDYTRLFPSFYASYKRNEKNNFTLSYGKRIQRPRFRDLNPFRVVINSNTFSVGNPFLRPSFIDNFEFKYTYKNAFTTNAFLTIENDGSSIIFTSDVENSTQIVTRANFFKQYIYGIGQSFLFNKLSWLESQNSINLIGSKTEFTEDIGAELQNGVAFSASSNNKITLNKSKSTHLQIDATYDSSFKVGLFSRGQTFGLNLGLSKHFLNKNLQFSVFVKDIFNTSGLNNLASIVNGVRQVYSQNDNNRFIRVSASYSFGNKKINEKKRSFGNEEERNRAN